MRKSIYLTAALICAMPMIPVAAASQSECQFSIPAGTLVAALGALARQCDLNLIYRSEDLGDATIAGLRGAMKPQAALRALLANSGFEERRGRLGAVAIVAVRPSRGVKTAALGFPVAALQAAAVAPEQAATADGEILVTARRRAERLQDVPVAASVVAGAALARQSISSMEDLRLVAPSVSFDRSIFGSGISLSVRGVSSSFQDQGIEQSILLDYDGMPMSRGRILDVAMFDVERVEILKGPQALFFGKNSPGGAVSIRSANPTNILTGYARAGYEFHGDKPSLEAAVSGPLSGNLSGRIAILASRSQGYIKNIHPGVDDPFRTAATGGDFAAPAANRLGFDRQTAGRLTLQYTGAAVTANIKLLYGESKGDYMNLTEMMGCGGGRTRPVLLGASDPLGDCKLNGVVSRARPAQTVMEAWPEARFLSRGAISENKTFLPVLTVNADIADAITLTSTTGYVWYKFRSGGLSEESSYSTAFAFYNKERFHDFSQELRVNSDFDGTVNFSAGAFFSDSKRVFLVGGENGARTPDPATGKYNAYDTRWVSDARSWSVFGQLRVAPLDGLEIAGGGRYTREKKHAVANVTFVHPTQVANFFPARTPLALSKTEDNFSPEATVSWKITPQLMAYGAYKTGYLAGGFSNVGILGPAASAATLSFDAEKVKGGEVGLKLSTGPLNGSLVGYRYIYKGLQVTAFDSVAITPRTQNAASTLVQGIELEGSYQLGAGLRLNGSVAYNDANYRDFPSSLCYAGQTVATGCIGGVQSLSGRPVYRAPDWVGLAGARYETSLGDYNLDLNAQAQYSSSYYTSLTLNPVSIQNAYWIFSAGVGIETSDGRWRLSLIGNNLTDNNYAVLANDSPGGAGDVTAVSGGRRTVTLQAQVRF